MSDEVANPKSYPHQAAQQIIIELIKAGQLGAGADGKPISILYENLLKEFKRINSVNQS
ncbi:TPA: hypothetical protein ACRRXZ_003735 [Morganella morganii]